jgi:beta-lactamase regulating signal transducer with metallopeptidase domain
MINMDAVAAWAAAGADWLITQSLYAGVVAAVVWLLVTALRINNPRWLLALWSLVLLRLVVPVDLASPLSLRAVVGWAGASLAIAADLPDTMARGAAAHIAQPALTLAPVLAPTDVQEAARSAPPPILWPLVAMTIWALVVTGVVLIVLAQTRAVRRRINMTSEATDPALLEAVSQWRQRLRVEAPVCLKIGVDPVGPFTLGVVRPVIYLPRRLALGLNAADLDAVIGHEMAHIAARDWIWLLGERLLLIMFFFHPLVWLAVSRLHDARETLRDQQAIEASRLSPQRYLGGLLSAIRLQSHATQPLLLAAPALGAPAERLKQRILWLKGANPMKPLHKLALAATTLLLAVTVLPLAQSTEAAPVPPEPPAPRPIVAEPAVAPKPPAPPKAPSVVAKPAKPRLVVVHGKVVCDSAKNITPANNAACAAETKVAQAQIDQIERELAAKEVAAPQAPRAPLPPTPADAKAPLAQPMPLSAPGRLGTLRTCTEENGKRVCMMTLSATDRDRIREEARERMRENSQAMAERARELAANARELAAQAREDAEEQRIQAQLQTDLRAIRADALRDARDALAEVRDSLRGPADERTKAAMERAAKALEVTITRLDADLKSADGK